jgi:hypothetical protein
MAEERPSGGQAPSTSARGVFLTVDDIERLVKSFGQNVKPPGEGAVRGSNCGVIVCGNGAALA